MISPRLPRTARLSLVGLLALASVGCGPTPSAPGQTKPNSKAEPTQPVTNDEPGDAVPVIASDEAEFDFGTIAPSGSVTHVFKIVNRGTADLHIERVERT